MVTQNTYIMAAQVVAGLISHHTLAHALVCTSLIAMT